MDGVEWFTLGAVTCDDLLAQSQRPTKDDQPWTFWAEFGEQIVRHDVFEGKGWNEAYELKNSEDNAHYHQLALCPNVRLTIDSYSTGANGERLDDAFVTYGLNITTIRQDAPPVPIGRRSASLLGTFAQASGTGALTTGSRTTTAGSLITAAIGVWDGTSSVNVPTATDNKSNTFTEATELNFGSFASLSLCYNIGGTRGASHTLSVAAVNRQAMGGQEWDGISASPTVTVGSPATGTSTLTSASVTPPASALVLLLSGYDGSSATFINAGSTGTQAQDIDELNTFQAVSVRYLPAQTSTATLEQAIDASRLWGAIAVAFSEVAPVVALTGTVTATIDEDDIVAGGKTIILTVSDDTVVPTSEVSDISFIANALGGTADTTSFSITLPTTQADDILILEFTHRGTGNGTIGGTSITTGGLTWTLKKSQTYGGALFSGKTYWTRATGNHSGQTVTGSGLTNSCAAIVTQYRGALASGDPLADATVVGEENASGNETQAQITTATDKAWVVLVVVNSPDLAISTQACTSPGALTERAERLSTGGTDTSISHASAEKATAGATGAFTWAQTNAASGSWAYAITPNTTSPFPDARAAIIAGLDSAQSEATGWDAKVKPNIPVANVVRTSSTVITITLQAQADYDISAQETITATVPASAFASGIAAVATPTFTIDPAGAGAQALTLSHRASTAVVYAPTLIPEQLLVLPHRASTAVVHAPTVIPEQAVTLPHRASTAAVHAPTVVGEQALTLPTVASTAVVHAPSAAYRVTVPHKASAAVTYAPTVTPEQAVTVPHIASTAVAYAPSIVSDQAITLPTVASTAQMFAPTTAYRVALPTVTSTAVVYAPTTAYRVSLSHVGSTAVAYTPSLVSDQVLALSTVVSTAATFVPSVAYQLVVPHRTSTVVVYAPSATYRMAVPHVASSAVTYTPSLISEQVLALSTVTSTVTAFAPSTAYRLVLAHRASTEIVFTPSVAYRVAVPTVVSTAVVYAPSLAYRVSLPTRTSTAAVFAPTIQESAGLSLPTIPSGSVVFAPTLIAEALLTLPTIAPGSIAYAPTLAEEGIVALPTVSSTAVVYAPSVAYRVALSTVTSTASVYAPSMAYRLGLPAVASTAVAYAPSTSVVIQLPTIASIAVVYAPSITYRVVLSTVSSSAVAYAPTIAAGAITLELPTIDSQSMVFVPFVVRDTDEIIGDTVTVDSAGIRRVVTAGEVGMRRVVTVDVSDVGPIITASESGIRRIATLNVGGMRRVVTTENGER